MTRITGFGFEAGDDLSNKYQIIEKIGAGWEGEVYLVKEKLTGIERACKLFFPHRNLRNKSLKFQAKKQHKLRHCSILTQYYTQDTLFHQGEEVTYLVSEFVDGELLSSFIKRQPKQKLSPFQGVHFLYALSKGVEKIHQHNDYHGDLHTDNIIIQRYGLGFDIKVIDMFHLGRSKKESIELDVIDIINIFYEILGGQKFYKDHPSFIKEICCGKNKTKIRQKFKNAGDIRRHLEIMSWEF